MLRLIAFPFVFAMATACQTPFSSGSVIAPAAMFPTPAARALPMDGTVTAFTDDGVTVYGELYFGGLPPTSPLILLFHQAGANGRSEYEPLVGWLNREGYRAIAWDLRSGGDRFGGNNRTVDALPTGSVDDYCAVSPDIDAAIGFVRREGLAEQVILWGSSYSASLVFKAAKDHPDDVQGIVAFSPAGGGPMETCRARMWAPSVRSPMLVVRPLSEMANPSVAEQRTILEENGAVFLIMDDGIHGSSTLVDERTGKSMKDDRKKVGGWLKSLTTERPPNE